MLTRQLRAAYTDPVDEWKRQALSNVRVGGSEPRDGAGFEVRTRLGFVLVVMVAGAPLGVIGWAVTLLTLLSVLLVHELPLALSARLVRRTACIVLSASGSDTELSGPPFSSRKALALSTLGSLANVAVGIVLVQLVRRGLAGGAGPLLSAAAVAHLVWGLGQALPLTPFRAGVAIARRLRPPLRFAYAALSFVCIGVGGLYVLRAPELPSYFSIFILVTVASTSALRDAFNDLQDDQGGVAMLSAAAAARLREDQPAQAAELARRALASASVEANRQALWKTLAWAAIGKRDPFTAHGALLSLGAGARDLHLVGAYLACCGRVDEAIQLLREAHCHGHRSRETLKLLIDLLVQSGRQPEALAVAETDRTLLTAEDWSVIESSTAPGGGSLDHAYGHFSRV